MQQLPNDWAAAWWMASNIQPAAESLRLCRLDARATTLVRFIPWPSMLHPHPLFTMKDGHPTATSMPIYSGCQNLRRIHPIFPSAHLQQTSLRHGVNPSRQEFNGVGEFKF
jgi:hypothetical protein